MRDRCATRARSAIHLVVAAPWIAAHITGTGTHREAFRGVQRLVARSPSRSSPPTASMPAGLPRCGARPSTRISSNSSGSGRRPRRRIPRPRSANGQPVVKAVRKRVLGDCVPYARPGAAPSAQRASWRDVGALRRGGHRCGLLCLLLCDGGGGIRRLGVRQRNRTPHHADARPGSDARPDRRRGAQRGVRGGAGRRAAATAGQALQADRVADELRRPVARAARRLG
jgi:hypothetical protein